ncbi:hypothetical protein DFH09DRAFT_1358025 [Mycena vulgaris]|nr:hypothetical protein DFH09DRAFT_1358025 [Mycena vulgaris]
MSSPAPSIVTASTAASVGGTVCGLRVCTGRRKGTFNATVCVSLRPPRTANARFSLALALARKRLPDLTTPTAIITQRTGRWGQERGWEEVLREHLAATDNSLARLRRLDATPSFLLPSCLVVSVRGPRSTDVIRRTTTPVRAGGGREPRHAQSQDWKTVVAGERLRGAEMDPLPDHDRTPPAPPTPAPPLPRLVLFHRHRPLHLRASLRRRQLAALRVPDTRARRCLSIPLSSQRRRQRAALRIRPRATTSPSAHPTPPLCLLMPAHSPSGANAVPPLSRLVLSTFRHTHSPPTRGTKAARCGIGWGDGGSREEHEIRVDPRATRPDDHVSADALTAVSSRPDARRKLAVLCLLMTALTSVSACAQVTAYAGCKIYASRKKVGLYVGASAKLVDGRASVTEHLESALEAEAVTICGCVAIADDDMIQILLPPSQYHHRL